MSSHNRLAVASITLLCFLHTSSGQANPNHKDATAPLAAHGTGASKDLYTKIATLYGSAVKETKTQLDAVANGRGARLSGKAIGQTRAKLLQVERLAPILQIYGEPAAPDFALRYRDVGVLQWDHVVVPFSAAPTSQKYVSSIRLAIQKQTPARMKTLQRLEKLAAEEQWLQAETELYRLFDGLEVGTCFLSLKEREDIAKPFGAVRGAIDQAMRRIRSQEAASLLGQSRTQQTPDFTSHTTALREAVAAIAASGQAAWDGEQLSGPQIATKIGSRWTEVHVACIRCRALDWAMQPLLELAGANAARISPDPTSEMLQRDYTQFSTAAIESITAVIEADAARLSGDEAARLYVEYLEALAPLSRQIADSKDVAAWESALEQLAAKSPGFQGEVDAYRAATRELLRWRAKTAVSIAQARSSEFPTLDKYLYDATVTKGSVLGLFPERPDNQLAPRLLASAPQVINRATPLLLGKNATAFNVVRVTSTSSSAIARYRVRTYANVSADLDLADQVSALQQDLMVGPQAPALTLAAASSLQSAERGDLAAIGGEIVGNHLEGLITRFATLPVPASILVPLGVLPVEDIKQPLLPQMLMRFDLKPTWVQHKHFYADLSGVGPQ